MSSPIRRRLEIPDPRKRWSAATTPTKLAFSIVVFASGFCATVLAISQTLFMNRSLLHAFTMLCLAFVCTFVYILGAWLFAVAAYEAFVSRVEVVLV